MLGGIFSFNAIGKHPCQLIKIKAIELFRSDVFSFNSRDSIMISESIQPSLRPPVPLFLDFNRNSPTAGETNP